MKNEPSLEQVTVKDALVNTLYNIFINATAGSGKTTTLVWLLSFLINKRVLCCAFNKDIKEELEERCKIYPNVKVSTLHGLGYGILKKEYGSGAPNSSKYRKIFLDMSPRWTLPDDKDFGGRVLQLIDLLRLTHVKTLQEAIDTAKFYNISNVDNEVNIALEVIEAGRAIVTDIDFTDMIYLPVYYNLAPRTRYQVICVDEVQDLNKLQRAFIFKYLEPGGRMIMVGDKYQCQPAGTMVQMADGTTKPIEQLVVGNELVSYNARERGGFMGYDKSKGFKVLETKARPYNGKMYTITSAGKASSYTPNHKCYVKFDINHPTINTDYCVYLMKDGDRFRIGISRLFSNGHMGATMRCTQEHAQAYWLLKIVNTKSEALYWEYVYMVKYGIPDIVFLQRNKTPNGFSFTQDQINSYYSNFPNLSDKAKILLNDLDLDIDYPFFVKHSGNMGGRTKAIRIYAANLISNYMLVGHFDPDNRQTRKRKNRPDYKAYPAPLWIPIDSLEVKKYNGMVYSLNVDVHHNYIADGILTENCIYSFAGADVRSFNILQNMPNTKVFPLSVTYRCPKAVVRYLGKYNTEIKAWDKSPEGSVNQDAAIEDVRSGDAILCRNGMPLAKLCMQFLSKGIKAYIRGRDIGENLIRLLEKTKKSSTIDAIKWLSEDLDKMKMKLVRAHRLPVEDIEEMPEFIAMSDKIDTIKAITYGCLSVGDAVMKIKRIFADDKREGIMLSTIHKSKGLEFDNVYIVCDWLMPSKYAKTPTEKEQENNIQFVAYSRVKKTLNFIPKETFDPYKKEKSPYHDKQREFEGR